MSRRSDGIPVSDVVLSHIPYYQCGVTAGMLAEAVFGTDDARTRHMIQCQVSQLRRSGLEFGTARVTSTEGGITTEYWVLPNSWEWANTICSRVLRAEAAGLMATPEPTPATDPDTIAQEAIDPGLVAQGALP